MEVEAYIKFAAALVFVLALIGLVAVLAKRFGVGLPSTPLLRNGKRRLRVVEVATVDAKRRLVLLRRDDTEHLVLLGVNSELLIESGIPTDSASGAPSSQQALPDGKSGARERET